jgi:surface antigen
MILQAARRLQSVGQRHSSAAFKALFIFTLAAAGFLGLARPAHAAAVPPEVADDCESLAQGATVSRTNLSPRPFDAAQIPGSPAFTFTTDSGDIATLVACQQKVINANPSAPYFADAYQKNFNQANWDGYGNPFQCVELIGRYDWLRWHDTDANGNKWVWGNAAENWNRHPERFTRKVNGGDTAPAAGDILIWNDNDYGHIAVIVDVDDSAQTATILEQNFTYAYAHTPGKFIWYTGKRALDFDVTQDGDTTRYTLTGAYTAWRQDGTTFTGMDARPVGWLHA